MENHVDTAQPDRRELVLQAAEKLMVAQGTPAITTESLVLESGVPEEKITAAFDSIEEVITPVLERLLLRFEETANRRTTLLGRLEQFVTLSMELMVGNGVDAIRGWVRESIHSESSMQGMKAALAFWNGASRFFENAVEDGILTENTPVAVLTNQLSNEYFGTLFCWCLMSGADIDPLHTLTNYCRRDLPALLEEYWADDTL